MKFKLLIQQLTELRRNSQCTSSREIPLLRQFSAKDIPNPFHELPNVARSWIFTNVLDPLLQYMGIAKRLTPEMNFEKLSWKTRAMNRYIGIMHYRELKLLEKGDVNGYWILALKLMRNSKVLHLVALRKLDKNWHMHYSLPSVKLMLRQLRQTFTELPVALEVHRFYQPKIKSDGTKTFRPLGNPKDVHKMFYYLWQCFFVVFLYSYIGTYQQGFLPTRKISEAWRQLQIMIKDQFMWEFDLEGAFPSLNVNHTCDRLNKLGCPGPICELVWSFTVETVEKLDKTEALMPEPKVEEQERLQSDHGSYLKGTNIFGMIREKGDPWTFPLRFWASLAAVFTKLEVPDFIEDKAGFLQEGPAQTEYPIITGFTQGSGLSPILFDFAFQDGIKEHFDWIFGSKYNYKMVAYADDFIISAKVDSGDILTAWSPHLGNYGFKISEKKSKKLKHEGMWLFDSFKFLGLTWDTVKNRIIGTPRSGHTLEMDKELPVAAFINRNRELTKFMATFPGYARTTQEVLDGWGLGESPFSLIPDSVMIEGKPFEEPQIAEIAKTISREEQKPLNEIVARKRSERNDWSGSGSTQQVGPFQWLHSRLDGTILARLFSGKWVPTDELPEISQTKEDGTLRADPGSGKSGKSSRPVNERSWHRKFAPEQLKDKKVLPTLLNETSLAILDLAEDLKGNRLMKLKKGMAEYISKVPKPAKFKSLDRLASVLTRAVVLPSADHRPGPLVRGMYVKQPLKPSTPKQ